MPNRLAHETSPYLLQHQHNPVDWHPWGEEAIDRARREQKPIFLSIGYAACHWCHVMEHESFEDPRIAAELNRHFVCIKVDREERPDLDHLYMTAVQLLTGRGGWPMSVFLTPDLAPFFGGTYWPPTSRGGMPGFDRVIAAVAEAWEKRRPQAIAQAHSLTEHIQQASLGGAAGGLPQPATLTDAASKLEQAFDFTHGGFGTAPKFPHSMDVQFLLRVWQRHPRPGVLDMVRLTLDKMAQGGIYDHLGGGFARYSVDERWLVPHFEKMLYDNALLAAAYLEGFQATGELRYAQVVRETLDYLLRDMTDATGGLHSTEDADSEGHEGKFYVWSPAEIAAVLGPAAARFNEVYGVTERGNFEGRNILFLPRSLEQMAALRGEDAAELAADMAACRAKLLAVRNKRVRPGKDDKILTSWNGLAIEALARASAVLGEPRYLAAAENAARFVLQSLRRGDGRLLRAWRLGQAKHAGCLDDYAYLAQGLISLTEAGGNEDWLATAEELAGTMLARFRDPELGGFFYTADDHEALLARHKDFHDSSIPSGNGMAATVLLRLNMLTGRSDYLAAAESALQAGAEVMRRAPLATGQLLIAADLWLGPRQEVALVGDRRSAATARAVAGYFGALLPRSVLAVRSAQDCARPGPVASLFAGKAATLEPTAYVCQNHACQSPVSGDENIAQLWRALAQPGPLPGA